MCGGSSAAAADCCAGVLARFLRGCGCLGALLGVCVCLSCCSSCNGGAALAVLRLRLLPTAVLLLLLVAGGVSAAGSTFAVVARLVRL